MPRWAVFCAFAVLLLAAGVLAGQGVHSSLATVEPEPLRSMEEYGTACSAAFTQSESLNNLRAAESAETFSPIMRSDRFDAVSASLVSETKAAPTSLELLPAASAPDTNVAQLIQKTFPDADPETVRIWAESYSGMDLSEVEFILEQKRLISGSLEAGPPRLPEMSFLLDHTESFSDDQHPLTKAIHSVSRNLSSEWTVGFRRTVLLPDMKPESCGEFVHQTPEFQALMYCSFDPGRLISSPLSLHVALPANDGALMFRLEGNRLTRRGDFQVLADRRVGLMTHAGPVALLDTAVLPAGATAVSVSASCEIHYVDTAGMTVSAGFVKIARIADLSELSSNDGVIFDTRSSESLSTLEPDTIRLSPGTLELSNVDRGNERALLNLLQSLKPDSLRDVGCP